MQSFEQLACEQAVKQLFEKAYFDITQLDKIGEMLGRNPSQHASYKFLRGLHCVHYSEMKPELRSKIEPVIIECLGGNGFNPARVLYAITDEGNDFAFTEDRFLHQSGKLSRIK